MEAPQSAVAPLNPNPASPAVAEADPNRWPPQIKYIVGNEAAERFSYYGVRGILSLYITGALLQTDNRATTIIHMFVFVNYFMPLLGAYVSERWWGRYHTILWISLFYCAGHGVMATSDLFHTVDGKLNCLYVGLGLIAFGSGGIKPCVSAFMGDQFRADQAHLMRKAYSVFYFSINFGSIFSFLVIPWIAKTPAPQLVADAGFVDQILWQLKHAGFSGYSWAFGVPGIAMALATLVFWLGTKHYTRKPPNRATQTAGFFKVFLAAFANLPKGNPGLTVTAVVSVLTSIVLPLLTMIGMVYVGFRHDVTPAVKSLARISLGCMGLWYLLVLITSVLRKAELPDLFWAGARGRFKDAEIAAARSVSPILAVLGLLPAFWALYDQSMSTWVLQGKKLVEFQFLTLNVQAEQMQSLNALLILILVPIFAWGLYPWIERRGLQVTALRRMSLGFVFTVLSFLVVAWLQKRLEAGEQVSLKWQAIPYLFLTIGEVLISTTGLEFAYTQALPSMKSTIMGFFLLSVAIGNLIVTTITQLLGQKGDEAVTSERFFLYALLATGVGVLFIIIAVSYRYRDLRQTVT
jgi:POT family proton-dependent oligopeptide transporter